METLVSFFNENLWLAVYLVAMLTVPITSALNIKLNVETKWKQIVSWITSFVLTGILYFTNVFSDLGSWYIVIPVVGLISGLSSNGIYDIPTIKKYVNDWLTKILVFKNEKN